MEFQSKRGMTGHFGAYMALPVPKFPVSSWNWGGFAIYVGLGTELVLVFCEFKGLVSNWFW